MAGLEAMWELFEAMGAAFAVIGLITLVLSIMCIVAQWRYIAAVGNDPGVAAIVPFWCTYAFANTVKEDSDGTVAIVGGLKVKKTLFRWYWLVAMLVAIVPLVGSMASAVINILCGFVIYREAYVRIDKKQPSEVTGIAIVSLFLPVFPFKMLSGNNQMFR